MRLTNLVSFVLAGVSAGVAMAVPPVVTFENASGGPSREGDVIGDQFWESHGVRFGTSVAGHQAILAEVGAPFKAFRGYLGNDDFPFPGAAVGRFFLTDSRMGPGVTPGPFVIDYRWPVARMSGVFIDVNEQESWRAEAFDAAGNSRGSVQIFPTLLAGSAISWSLETDDPVITRVVISFTGIIPPGGVTFAMDNIGGSERACAADLNDDGITDFADYLEFLSAYDTGAATADFNRDGLVDFQDYLEFLTSFDTGC